jgi:hypothetical protein
MEVRKLWRMRTRFRRNFCIDLTCRLPQPVLVDSTDGRIGGERAVASRFRPSSHCKAGPVTREVTKLGPASTLKDQQETLNTILALLASDLDQAFDNFEGVLRKHRSRGTKVVLGRSRTGEFSAVLGKSC